MKIDRGPYRDNDYVLRCRHGAKLHLACDDCQAEERDREDAEAMGAMGVLVLACVGFAVGFGLMWFLLTRAW